MPVAAAFIEADTFLGVAHQLIFVFLQLEVVHVETLIGGAGVEDELVSRNGKERAGQLPDARLVEVLQVLTGRIMLDSFLRTRLRQFLM